jgi:septal ring factor EnvC (AmiA/AmiB activator)
VKISLAFCLSLLLAACEDAPVKVTPQVNVAAVRSQNKQTQTHIQHTRQHIDKEAQENVQADEHVKSAEKTLDELLKQ